MVAQKEESIRQKIGHKISGLKQIRSPIKTLGEHSIDIIKDDKHQTRVALLIHFQDQINGAVRAKSLLAYVRTLKKRLDLLHGALYEIGVVYAGAGSHKDIAVMLEGWIDEYRISSNWILVVEDIINPTYKNQKEKDALAKYTEGTKEHEIIKNAFDLERGLIDHSMLVRYLHDALSKFIFPDGFLFLGKCFRDEHIGETAAIVIQSMVPMLPQEGGGETMTGSGGATSEDGRYHMRKPRGGPYPQKMEHSVG